MRIVPVSPTATRVMLLGAGELGKEVITASQRPGIEILTRPPDIPMRPGIRWRTAATQST